MPTYMQPVVLDGLAHPEEGGRVGDGGIEGMGRMGG